MVLFKYIYNKFDLLKLISFRFVDFFINVYVVVLLMSILVIDIM